MRIGISGHKGRIGSLLVQEVENHPDLTYAGGIDKGDDADALFAKADAVIDFSAPDATRKNLWLAAKHKTILVIGTSGLSAEDETEMQEAARETPIVYAANTSVGVNMMMELVKQSAARLDGANWDAEIIDAHHRFKVDAPSGTSYALADSIKEGRDEENAELVHARKGHTGPRKEGSIGFSVQRGGDTTIENSVIFFGNGERLEITHRAFDRSIFAKGAVRAALWARDQSPGLYKMADVLEL